MINVKFIKKARKFRNCFAKILSREVLKSPPPKKNRYIAYNINFVKNARKKTLCTSHNV